DGALERPAVGERRAEAARVVDHVVVRDEVPVRRDDDARASTAGPPAPIRPLALDDDTDDRRPHGFDHRHDGPRVCVEELYIIGGGLRHVCDLHVFWMRDGCTPPESAVTVEASQAWRRNAMVEGATVLVLVAVLIFGPIAWRVVRDRR